MVGLAGGACLLAAAVMGSALHQVRGAVAFDRVAGAVVGIPSPVSGQVALFLARVADRAPIAVYLLVLATAAALLHRRARPVLAVLVAGPLTQGLVLLAKRLVDRTLFSDGPTYPSGHVAGSTVLAVLAVLVVRNRSRRVTLIVAGGVGLVPLAAALGAIWTQSHVWTDVVGGALTGAGVALLLWVVLVPVQPPPEDDAEEGNPSHLAARAK